MSVVHNAVLTCLFSSLVFSTQTNSTLIFSWADTPHKGFGKQLGDNPQRRRRESGENMWQYQERENSANCEIAHWLLLWWTDWIPAWGSSRNLTEQCWIQYQRRGEHHLWGCDSSPDHCTRAPDWLVETAEGKLQAEKAWKVVHLLEPSIAVAGV